MGTALKTWMLENQIEYIEMDQIFKHDAQQVQAQIQTSPWKKEFVCFCCCCCFLGWFSITNKQIKSCR